MKYKFCEGCTLIDRPLVYGKAGYNYDVVIIGEAPGATEAIKGVPFVGDAGQVLRDILEELGCKVETFPISNAVLCHPVDAAGKNRTPTPLEIEHCNGRLLRSIAGFRPKTIIALGRTAYIALTGNEVVTMGAIVGKTFKSKNGFPVMVTWHPSYILRNRSVRDLVKQHIAIVVRGEVIQ
jgi:uracil-DNA glycosylase